jgi:8-oxo-dGTP pyrophosphatase MutT (NUDIX family)
MISFDREISYTFTWFLFCMRLSIQVQAIIFKKISGRLHYLLLKRTSEREGFWQPVTGGLEEGETKVEALEREVLEETGIKNIVGIIENVHYFEYSDPYSLRVMCSLRSMYLVLKSVQMRKLLLMEKNIPSSNGAVFKKL